MKRGDMAEVEIRVWILVGFVERRFGILYQLHFGGFWFGVRHGFA